MSAFEHHPAKPSSSQWHVALLQGQIIKHPVLYTVHSPVLKCLPFWKKHPVVQLGSYFLGPNGMCMNPKIQVILGMSMKITYSFRYFPPKVKYNHKYYGHRFLTSLKKCFTTCSFSISNFHFAVWNAKDLPSPPCSTPWIIPNVKS